MATFGEKDQRITVARGPGSPFAPGQPLNIPGIGTGYPTDYGPKVRGIDIPVSDPRMVNDPRFNRTVMINGIPTKLTAYVPKAADPRNVDPLGGGNFDTRGNRIIMFGGQPAGGRNKLPPWYNQVPQGSPKVLAPNELPQPIESAPATFTPSPFELGLPNPNPPPNEGQQYPIPVTGPNPVPNEQQYPTPVDTYTPPAVYNPAPNEQQYPTPITTPYNPPVYDYNINPTPNDFFRGQTPYNPPVYDQSSPTPIDIYQPEYYNPPPNETQYPTPIEQPVNPVPNEDMLPTPIDTYQPDLSNPAPNEDMTATPVDMYYPSGDGTYTPLDENGNPVPEPAPAPEKPLPPMPSGTVDLPISRPWTSVRDIGGYRWVGGTGQYPTMPPQWANNLVGAYGVGGGGGSYFGGSSNWSPLPGSFTPTSFGGSGTIYNPFQAGGPAAYGPYGVIQAGGGTGGTGKSPTSSQ